MDEIMSLSLIEAADLCDMCQEKLAERSGFSASAVPGRAPFPHPMAMSAGEHSAHLSARGTHT